MNYVGIDHHRQYSHLTVMERREDVFRFDMESVDIIELPVPSFSHDRE